MTAIKDLFEAQTQKEAFYEEKNLENQYEVQRWLKARKKGTKNLYLIAIRAFLEYTGLSPKQLIDLAEEDRKKSARQRGDPEFKICSFYDYLVNDYIQKGKGKTYRTPDGKKGLSRSTASSFANAIRGFYKQNGFPLILKLPKSSSKKENFKLPLRPPDIKRLFDTMANLRDKAILLTIYFSGIGVNELCNLTYGDVAEGLQKNEEPLHLHLIRKKEEVEFDTFLGTEAIDALKVYLAQRRRNEETLRENSPLFILQHTTKPGSNKVRKVYPNLVEASFTNAALKAGLVTRERLDASDINPCRPHAAHKVEGKFLKDGRLTCSCARTVLLTRTKISSEFSINKINYSKIFEFCQNLLNQSPGISDIVFDEKQRSWTCTYSGKKVPIFILELSSYNQFIIGESNSCCWLCVALDSVACKENLNYYNEMHFAQFTDLIDKKIIFSDKLNLITTCCDSNVSIELGERFDTFVSSIQWQEFEMFAEKFLNEIKAKTKALEYLINFLTVRKNTIDNAKIIRLGGPANPDFVVIQLHKYLQEAFKPDKSGEVKHYIENKLPLQKYSTLLLHAGEADTLCIVASNNIDPEIWRFILDTEKRLKYFKHTLVERDTILMLLRALNMENLISQSNTR